MKRILTLAGALLLAACTALPALAGPNSVVLTQRNAANTANVIRTMEDPASTGMLVYNPATGQAGFLTIGPGLSASSGVLSAPVVAGSIGQQGIQGIQGVPGRDGRDGTNGLNGTNGLSGFDGKNAYELATVSGFNGTLQAWLASLKGAAGADGLSIVGATGPQGAPGIGIKGDKGDTGATGAQGVPGTPAPTFNYGLPVARTLALSTSYQATNTAKPAIVTISPVCSASLTLAGGTTCTLQARIGTAPLTCSSGVVVATWTNGNTGALTVGLSLNQIVGAPYGINLPTGASFILCPTAGTFTVTAVEQSAG